jgi:hypothetical protein
MNLTDFGDGFRCQTVLNCPPDPRLARFRPAVACLVPARFPIDLGAESADPFSQVGSLNLGRSVGRGEDQVIAAKGRR